MYVPGKLLENSYLRKEIGKELSPQKNGEEWSERKKKSKK